MFIKRAILHPSSLLAAVRQKTLQRKSGIFAVTWSDSPRNHLRNLRNKIVRNSLLHKTPWGFRGATSCSGEVLPGSREELPGSSRALPFWFRRRIVTSAPRQNLPLLAPKKAAPSGSRQDLPPLVPDKTSLFWLKRRSASSGSGQVLPLLAEMKSFLFFNDVVSFAKF